MPAVVGSSRPPFNTGRRAPERRGIRAKDLPDKAGEHSTCCRRGVSFESDVQKFGNNINSKARTRAAADNIVEKVQAQRLLLLEELLQRKDEEQEQERSLWQREVGKLKQQFLFYSRKKLPFDPLCTRRPPDTSSNAEPSAAPSSSLPSEKEFTHPCKNNDTGCLPGTIRGSGNNAVQNLWDKGMREQGARVQCLCVPLGVPSYGAFDYYNWADKHSLRCQKRQFETASRAATEMVCMYKTPDHLKQQETPTCKEGDQQNWLSKCNLTCTADTADPEDKLQILQSKESSVEEKNEEGERSLMELANPKNPCRSETGGRSPNFKEKVKLKVEEEIRGETKARQRKQGIETEGKGHRVETCKIACLRCRAAARAVNESRSTESPEQATEFTRPSTSQRRLKEKAQHARGVAIGEARGKVRQRRSEIQRRHVDHSILNRKSEDTFRAENMPFRSRSRLIHEQNITKMILNAEKRRKKKEEEERAQFWRRFVKYC